MKISKPDVLRANDVDNMIVSVAYIRDLINSVDNVYSKPLNEQTQHEHAVTHYEREA